MLRTLFLLMISVGCLFGCGPAVGYTRVGGHTVSSYGDYGVITLKNNINGAMIKNIVVRASGQQCSYPETRDIELWPTQDVDVPIIKNYYGSRVQLEVTADVYTEHEQRPVGYVRETIWVSEQDYYSRFGQWGSSDSSFLVISRYTPLTTIDNAAKQTGWWR